MALTGLPPKLTPMKNVLLCFLFSVSLLVACCSGTQVAQGGYNIGSGVDASGNISTATLTWPKGLSALLTQSAQTTDAVTTDMSFTSQAPWASASTNKTPGNFTFNTPSPVGGALPGATLHQSGGTTFIAEGTSNGTGGSIWFGSAAVSGTRNSANWSLYGDNTGLIIQDNNLETINAGAGSGFIISPTKTSVMGPLGGNSSASVAMTLSAFGSSISVAGGGPVTLTASQYSNPVMKLTGALAAGNTNLVVPNKVGAVWYFDMGSVAWGGNSLTISNTPSTCIITQAADLHSLYIVMISGSGNLACQ